MYKCIFIYQPFKYVKTQIFSNSVCITSVFECKSKIAVVIGRLIFLSGNNILIIFYSKSKEKPYILLSLLLIFKTFVWYDMVLIQNIEVI